MPHSRQLRTTARLGGFSRPTRAAPRIPCANDGTHRRRRLSILVALESLALAACGGSHVQIGPTLPTASPTVALTSAPASFVTLGQTVTLSWSSTNAASCMASSSPAESDWQGTKAAAGTQVVTPSVAGAQTYSLDCSGFGGMAAASVVLSVAAAGATPSISSVTPQKIFLDAQGSTGLQINGSGFLPGCVLHDSLLGDTTLPAGTASGQIRTTLTIDTTHYSPGWITFSVTCAEGTSNTAFIAFVGDQNTLALSGSGALYQLDQAQGAPSGQNGFVRIFNAAGTGTGSFQVGAPANAITFADNTAQVLIDYPGGPVVMYDPVSGTAVNTAGVTFAPSVGVANANGLGCVTNPVQGDLSCFVVSVNAFNPPFIAVAAGAEPWSLAMTTLGTQTDAVVYSRQSTEVRLYSVVNLTGAPRITLKGSLVLAGLTPAAQLAGDVTGGWQLVTLDSGALAGTAAVLSQFDRLLVFVDLNTIAELRRVTLQGLPFRIAADATHAAVIVAFADVAAGLTRFATVDPATGSLTALTSTSTLLTTGLTVSADGASLQGAMRSRLVVLANH